jgi:hypothetical protein
MLGRQRYMQLIHWYPVPVTLRLKNAIAKLEKYK